MRNSIRMDYRILCVLVPIRIKASSGPTIFEIKDRAMVADPGRQNLAVKKENEKKNLFSLEGFRLQLEI